jgi:rhodanese-related sulfurtransferase
MPTSVAKYPKSQKDRRTSLLTDSRAEPKNGLIGRSATVAILAIVLISTSGQLSAQFTPTPTASALSIPEAQWMKPEALLQMQKAKGGEQPLIPQVGSHMLFAQAHIPGSEYAGPGSQQAGIQQLQNRVTALARKKLIVLYCGCCPLNRCPNLGPAYAKLSEMGFTSVKVLYLPSNFGADWADKGYPVERGN